MNSSVADPSAASKAEEVRAYVDDPALVTHRDIPWGNGGLAESAAWLSPQEAIDLANAMLSAIADQDAADLVEVLVTLVTEMQKEVGAVREVLSALLTHSHEQHGEALRIRDSNHRLLDARRRETRKP